MTAAPPHPGKSTSWHLAGSLVSLKSAVDAHWPGRDKRSDGGIGDARHQAEGSASDHNPWLNNTVRAYDFTVAQAGINGVDGAWLAEQLRLLGLAGDHRLAGGPTQDDNGYVIYAGQVTSADFTRWVPYTGSDHHDTHVHLSVTRDAAGYEDAGPWPFLATSPLIPSPAVVSTPPAPPQAPPAPTPAPPAGHPEFGPHPGNDAAQAPYPDGDPHPVEAGFPPVGHDATGYGVTFRAQWGNSGPAVSHLQSCLNNYAPAYSHLTVDGEYGEETAAVIEDFAHRIAANPYPGCPADDVDGLGKADGNSFGPRLARAAHAIGLGL